METRDLPETWLVRLILRHLNHMLSLSGVSMERSIRGWLVDSALLFEGMPEGMSEYLLECSKMGQEVMDIYELLEEAKRRYPRGKPKQLCLFGAGDIELESVPDLCIFWDCLACLERWYHDDAKGRPSFEIIHDETEIAEILMTLCPIQPLVDIDLRELLYEMKERRLARWARGEPATSA